MGAGAVEAGRSLHSEARVEPFRFEHTHRFDEQEYGRILALSAQPRARRSRRWWLRMAGLASFGVLLLCSAYTILLGIVWLALVGFLAVIPGFFPRTGRRMYRESKLLGQELAYGVSEREMWIAGPEYHAAAGWSYAGSWRIREDWLIVPCTGLPALYFPISGMRRAGVLVRVMELLRMHGEPHDREDAAPRLGVPEMHPPRHARRRLSRRVAARTLPRDERFSRRRHS
jgi:hypothetical protein